MRLIGWCMECKKVKQVRVSGSMIAGLARGNVPVGVCAQCEDDNDKKGRR